MYYISLDRVQVYLENFASKTANNFKSTGNGLTYVFYHTIRNQFWKIILKFTLISCILEFHLQEFEIP